MPRIVRDTREQLPWDFAPWVQVDRGLPFGDYAIDGHELLLAIERKTVSDFVSSVTINHETEWDKQARARAAGVPFVYVVEGWRYECLTPEILLTKLPQTVTGAIDALHALGVPVLFEGSRGAAIHRARELFLRRWRKLPMAVRRGA
jgi:ERCC4-type nuclease